MIYAEKRRKLPSDGAYELLPPSTAAFRGVQG